MREKLGVDMLVQRIQHDDSILGFLVYYENEVPRWATAQYPQFL